MEINILWPPDTHTCVCYRWLHYVNFQKFFVTKILNAPFFKLTKIKFHISILHENDFRSCVSKVLALYVIIVAWKVLFHCNYQTRASGNICHKLFSVRSVFAQANNEGHSLIFMVQFRKSRIQYSFWNASSFDFQVNCDN